MIYIREMNFNMKKILCVCDIGISRSVHFASRLKYVADSLAVGLNTTTPETLDMLCKWADTIIVTSPDQIAGFHLNTMLRLSCTM